MVSPLWYSSGRLRQFSTCSAVVTPTTSPRPFLSPPPMKVLSSGRTRRLCDNANASITLFCLPFASWRVAIYPSPPREFYITSLFPASLSSTFTPILPISSSFSQHHHALASHEAEGQHEGLRSKLFCGLESRIIFSKTTPPR